MRKREVIALVFLLLSLLIIILPLINAEDKCGCGCSGSNSKVDFMGNFCDLSGLRCLETDAYLRYAPAYGNYCQKIISDYLFNGGADSSVQCRLGTGAFYLYDCGYCQTSHDGGPIGCGNGQSCCGGNCYDTSTQKCCEDLSGQVCGKEEACCDTNGNTDGVKKTDVCIPLQVSAPPICHEFNSDLSNTRCLAVTPPGYQPSATSFNSASPTNILVDIKNGTICTIEYPGDGSEEGVCRGGNCVISKTLQVSMGNDKIHPIPSDKSSPDYYLNELGENERVACSASASKFNQAHGDKITEIRLVSDSGWSQSLKGFQETYTPYEIIFSVTFDNNGSMPRGKKVWCEATATLGGEAKTERSEAHVFVERNIKDESKYPENSAFVVSSGGADVFFDWRDILSSVSAVMWKNSSKDKWCQKLSDFDSEGNAVELEKCAYPLLINQQGSGVFGKNQPDDGNVNEYLIGNFFKENPQLVIQNIDPNKLKNMWKESGSVVVSDYNDYKKGLIASELAAYLNGSLVVFADNKNLQSDYLNNKIVYVDTSFKGNPQDKEVYENLKKYNIVKDVDFNQLLKDYVNSDKTIIVNPYDINKTYCEINGANQPKDYCGMSLLAPVYGFGRDMRINFVEASSVPGYVEMTKKQEEIDAAGDDQIETLEKQLEVMEDKVKGSAESIHGSIWNILDKSGIKEALVLSAPKAIPTYSSQFDFQLGNYYFDEDGMLEPDCCNCTLNPSITSERMYAKSPSDISGYIAGDLFSLPKCSCTGDLCSLGGSVSPQPLSLIKQPFLNYLAGYQNDIKSYKSIAQTDEKITGVSSEEFERFLAEQSLTKLRDMTPEEKTAISCAFKVSRQYYTSFIDTSGDFSRARIYPTEESQKMAVAHYYSLMFKLKSELMLNIVGVATGDYLAGKSSYLDGVSIDGTVASVMPDVKAKFDEVKVSPVYKSDPNHVTMKTLVDETVDILPLIGLYDEALKQLNEELVINNLARYKASNQGQPSNFDFSNYNLTKIDSDRIEINAKINQVESQKRLVTMVYYWVEGQKFKEIVGESSTVTNREPSSKTERTATWLYNSYYRVLTLERKMGEHALLEAEAKETVQQAIVAQIDANRPIAVKRINDIQDALVCMHTKKASYESCYEKIDSVLASTQMSNPYFSVPPLDINKYPGTGYSNKKDVETRVFSNGYLGANNEIYSKLISNRNFNAIIFDSSVMIGLVALMAVPGMLPVTALRLQALARIGVAVAGVVNAAYVYRGVEDTILKCRDLTIGTSDRLQPDVNDQIRANIGTTAIKDYTGCVVSVAMNLPVAVGGGFVAYKAVKMTIPAIVTKFRANFPAVEKRLKLMGDRAKLLNKDQRGGVLLGDLPAGCFLAGTKIKMADGSEKNIEDIKKGENVEAYDIDNNITVKASVTETFVRESEGYYIINYTVENE